MTRTFCRLLTIGRKSRPAETRPRRIAARWQAEALEDRALLSVTGLEVDASPVLLRRINPFNQSTAVKESRVCPVTVTGYVANDQGAAPTLRLRVVDEYGRDQPSRTLLPQPVRPGLFYFNGRIGLDLKRRPGDPDGRQYTIEVTAQDQENTRTTAVVVTTPSSLQAPRPHFLRVRPGADRGH